MYAQIVYSNGMHKLYYFKKWYTTFFNVHTKLFTQITTVPAVNGVSRINTVSFWKYVPFEQIPSTLSYP